MSTYDIHAVRKEFPALDLKVNGHAACFLDGPGGTQVPRPVLRAMEQYLFYQNSNKEGNFITSQETDKVMLEARRATADFLNCSPREVAFGQNATTLLFQLAFALTRSFQKGDEVLITRLDHEANRGPWQQVLGEKGLIIQEVGIDPETVTLDMEDFDAKLSAKTRLVAVTHASNAVGTIPPLEEIIKKARAVGALVVVDAVHYAMHGSIDVQKLDVDYLVCSAYKILGPHMGFLYGREEEFTKLETFRLAPQKETIPDAIETGTLNHEGIAGIQGAMDFLAHLGTQYGRVKENHTRRDSIVEAMRVIEEYQEPIFAHLYKGLDAMPGVNIYGPPLHDPRTATIAFTTDTHHPNTVSKQLGEKGIFTWAGHFYASTLIEDLGLKEKGGLIRVGLSPYNTKQEVEFFLETLAGILRQ